MRHKVPDRKALLDESNSAFFIAVDNTNKIPTRVVRRVFPGTQNPSKRLLDGGFVR